MRAGRELDQLRSLVFPGVEPGCRKPYRRRPHEWGCKDSNLESEVTAARPIGQRTYVGVSTLRNCSQPDTLPVSGYPENKIGPRFFRTDWSSEVTVALPIWDHVYEDRAREQNDPREAGFEPAATAYKAIFDPFEVPVGTSHLARFGVFKGTREPCWPGCCLWCFRLGLQGLAPRYQGKYEYVSLGWTGQPFFRRNPRAPPETRSAPAHATCSPPTGGHRTPRAHRRRPRCGRNRARA